MVSDRAISIISCFIAAIHAMSIPIARILCFLLRLRSCWLKTGEHKYMFGSLRFWRLGSAGNVAQTSVRQLRGSSTHALCATCFITPGIPQTNGLTERIVRKTKEGARCNLAQAGLSVAWWAFALVHFCVASNIPTAGGTSAHFERHKSHFRGPSIPYGAFVEVMLTPDESRDGFGSKTEPGIFLGCHFQPGGKWSGEFRIMEYRSFKSNLEATPRKTRIHLSRRMVLPSLTIRHARASVRSML